MNKEPINRYAIGIDVGGTRIKGVLFDGFRIIDKVLYDTPQDTLENLIARITSAIQILHAKAEKLNGYVRKAGIGIAGVLDSRGVVVLNAPNLMLVNNVWLKDEVQTSVLQRGVQTSITLDNDVDAFVRAEAKVGAGKGHKSVYGITLGTGIGGGWYVNRDVYRGSHGGAGEICNMIVDIERDITFEQAYQELMDNNPKKTAARAQECKAREFQAYSQFAKMLGVVLANIVNTIDPEVIVIGGGASRAANLFLLPAEQVMRERIESREAAEKVKVVLSKFGKNAGAIGACL